MLWWTLRQLKSRILEKRRKALHKLRGCGETRAVEAMLKVLRGNDLAVRGDAEESLSAITHTGATNVLISSLGDWKEHVRVVAARVLGRTASISAISSLVALLNDPLDSVRTEAAKALVILGWRPSNFIEQVFLALVLGDLSSIAALGSEAVDPLLAWVADKRVTYDLRVNAAVALGRLGDRRAVPLLVEQLRNFGVPAGSLVKASATALGQIGDVSVVEPLAAAWLRANGDGIGNSDLRLNCEKALVTLGEASVEPLARILNDSREEIRRWYAADMLGKIGGCDALSALLEALADPSSSLVRHVSLAIATIRDPRAVDPLILRLQVMLPCVPDWKSVDEFGATAKVVSFIEALAAIRDDRALQPLIDCLKKMNANVRSAAADALCQMGDSRAVAPLGELLADRTDALFRGAVRDSAAAALSRIGNAHALDLLQMLLLGERDKAWCIAADALANSGDERVMAPLLEAIEEYELARRKAEIEWQCRRSKESLFAVERKNPVVVTAIRCLQQVLERAAANVSTEDLKRTLDLSDWARMDTIEDEDHCTYTYILHTVDCWWIRQLARVELNRRQELAQ